MDTKSVKDPGTWTGDNPSLVDFIQCNSCLLTIIDHAIHCLNHLKIGLWPLTGPGTWWLEWLKSLVPEGGFIGGFRGEMLVWQP